MTKVGSVVAATLLSALGTAAAVAPVEARPPTVQSSPGYQARLAESRKAYTDAWNAWQAQPPAPSATRPTPRRAKRHAAPH